MTNPAWKSRGVVRGLSLLTLTLCAMGPSEVSAQRIPPPEEGGLTTSLGFPRSWKFSVGYHGGQHLREEAQLTTLWRMGVYRDLLNPVMAALGVRADAYVGNRSTDPDGGLRLQLQSPFLRLGAGVDYNLRDDEADFALTLTHPLRRGGILTSGGVLELDWLPGRGHSYSVGITLPIGQPFAGRSRPQDSEVRYEAPSPSVVAAPPTPFELNATLNEAAEIASRIARLTAPFVDRNGGSADEAVAAFAEDVSELKDLLNVEGSAPGVVVESHVRRYHGAVEEAFSMAGSGSSQVSVTERGRRLAAISREVLLEYVILPFNRSLGRKKEKKLFEELGIIARGVFSRRVHLDDLTTGNGFEAEFWVFSEVLGAIRTAHDQLLSDWDDNRFVWLPYQLVLLPEEHDTQVELDRLIERAVEQPFTDGNRIWYIVNEQFHLELGRTIREARDYHVLWVHDVRGLNSNGEPDAVSYGMATQVWLRAMIERVREYDRTGKFPTYMIILDQWFFEVNKGRLFLELLERPLDHRLELPEEFGEWEEEVRAIQEELREAVSESNLLQAEARHYGERWLKNLIKVHINITNPADPTFWSGEVVPFVGVPDNVMRDHRKIAFYDISEEDPFNGMAIYTGMGVGEGYLGASWEDRAIMVQGPALLTLRDAARALLRGQGFTEDEIPHALRARAFPDDYGEMIEHGIAESGQDARALEVHNAVGFSSKDINVLKATLYTLAPPGTVIKVPDSLWNAHIWTSLLLGSALRGVRVLVIAPSLASAPSPGFPNMSRSQEMLTRMLVAREILAQEIADAGGLLRVGVYDPDVEVPDVPGRALALLATLERYPFLRELYSFQDSVWESVEQVAEELEAEGFEIAYRVEQPATQPKLHLKAHYVASASAWNEMLERPEWAGLFRVYLRHLAHEAQAGPGVYLPYDELAREIGPLGLAMYEGYLRDTSEADRERAIFYLLVGSHNQNLRSMVMDGEVEFVTAGPSAMIGVLDFVILAGLSKWIETEEELEKLLPGYSNFKRRIGRWIRLAI